MSFSKRVQVLFLVSLCLTTFSCANRDLVDHTPADQQNHTTTKTGGGSGESGSGASIASAVVTGPGHVDEFGATNCGCHQPWYHPKPQPQPQPQPQPPCCGGGCGCPSVPGGSCGGGGGGPPSGGCGGSSCGGSSDGCGGNSPGGGCNNGGCQPPPITCPVGCVPAFGYGQWAYHWPMPSPGVGYMGTQSDPNQAGPNQENQNGDAMNNGSNPPMEMEKEKQDDQHNSGSSSINKGKHD